jgi:hypothetical protein
MSASIGFLPLPFHDIIEVFEYLYNLPYEYLYMYDGMIIYYNDYPRMIIEIKYYDNTHYITYKDIRAPFKYMKKPLRGLGMNNPQ